MTRPCRRRALLTTTGLLLAGLRGVHPAHASQQPQVLVAGAAGGRMARWAAVLAPALQRGWPAATGVDIHLLGGDDGVTGANRFEARGPSDGTALLLPGAAASAWLAGGPRVQFDAARWLPVLCGVSGGFVAGRRPLADARRSAPLRLAVADPLGAGAASLLGLDLLGVPTRPVVEEDGAAALRSGSADAAFLSGDGARATAAAAGAVPLFTLGSPDPSGADATGSDLPQLRTMLARVTSRDPALLVGWYAVAAAVQLDCALVLPALTDAASVALWREAADHAADDPALRAAADPDVRWLATPDCGAVLGAIATSSAALLAYRRWLSVRLGYQPG